MRLFLAPRPANEKGRTGQARPGAAPSKYPIGDQSEALYRRCLAPCLVVVCPAVHGCAFRARPDSASSNPSVTLTTVPVSLSEPGPPRKLNLFENLRAGPVDDQGNRHFPPCPVDRTNPPVILAVGTDDPPAVPVLVAACPIADSLLSLQLKSIGRQCQASIRASIDRSALKVALKGQLLRLTIFGPVSLQLTDLRWRLDIGVLGRC